MRIFLSYARADTPIAEEIAVTLKQAGHRVFFDQHRIQAAEDFNRVIWGEIQKADLFVFLISPNSVASGSYAQTELGFAERKWSNPERRVLPVVVEPTEFNTLPVYATICHILSPKGNVPAEVRAEVSKLAGRHRWVQIARTAAVGALLAGVGAGSFWGYQEYLEQKPLIAQKALAELEILYNENSFLDRAYKGDLNAVNLFLEAGMDPDTPSKKKLEYEDRFYTLTRGSTALMAAIFGGQMHVVERLLEAGADVEAKDNQGDSALLYAVLGGYEDLVRMMLKQGTPQDVVDNLFELAAEEGSDRHIAIMRLLLSKPFGVSAATIDRAFILAARNGDFGKMGLLAENIPDNARIASAALIDVSSRRGRLGGSEWARAYPKLIQHLLTMGADVNATDKQFAPALFAPADGDDGWTPLLKAVYGKDTELVRMFLAKGANPNVQCECSSMAGGGWTPLLMTIKFDSRNTDIIRLLLDHGADLNVARASKWGSDDNSTPLMLAAGNAENVTLLLENGSPVNDLSNNGYTALWHAVATRNLKSLELLLQHGADVQLGHNPLLATVSHSSLWKEFLPIAKQLLEAGADINKPSKKDGQTVLMRAVQTGDPDMVRFLVASGARVTDQDNQGRSALVFAKRGDNEEIIGLIQGGAETASIDSSQ